jgi:hypothetical protein
MPVPSPPLKTILELILWNGLQICRCITPDVIKISSCQYFLYLREQKKVTGTRSGEMPGCFNTVVVVAVVVVILAVVLVVVVLLVGVVVVVGLIVVVVIKVVVGCGGFNAAFQNATYRFTKVQLSNNTYPVYLRL